MRHGFPEDESRFGWLPLLLDAYAVLDEGVALAIAGEEARRGLKLACGNGCDSCCSTHLDIPVYPIELVGLWWFSTEKLANPPREGLKKNLSTHEKGDPCPFLLEHACSVYPVRPFACRQFNVFGRACGKGEDPYHERRGDVLNPIEEYTNRAFYITLPFYGVTGEEDKRRVIENNLIHREVRVLQNCGWKELAQKMDEFDANNGKG